MFLYQKLTKLKTMKRLMKKSINELLKYWFGSPSLLTLSVLFFFLSLSFILISSSLKILCIIKIAGAVISTSLSVISSVVDSVVDLLTSVILLWTARKIKNRDAYKYPGGQFSYHVIYKNRISSFS